MPHRGLALLIVFGAVAFFATPPRAQNPGANVPAVKGGDLELVQKVLAARKEYQKTLENLLIHYHQVGDQDAHGVEIRVSAPFVPRRVSGPRAA